MKRISITILCFIALLSCTQNEIVEETGTIEKITSSDVVLVAEYYGCSVRHAQSLLDLHSEDQLRTVRARLYKGGVATKKDAGYDK